MHERFASITVKWLECARTQYTGSIEDRARGLDFRYRFEHLPDRQIKASTYSRLCYEKATDVEEQIFPWTEEGVEAMKHWYQQQYEKYLRSAADCNTVPNKKEATG